MTRLTRISLANRTLVVLVTVVLMAVGVVAARGLKQELIPSIEIPSASVVSVFSGASPEVVELEVTKPVEDAVKAVSGVTRVTSRSSSSVSQVRVEWDFGANTDKVISDLRSAVDTAATRLPQGVNPSVLAGGFDEVPVVVLAVSSQAGTDVLTRQLEDLVVPRLQTIPGVRSVVIAGQEQQQVRVTLRRADVDRLGVDTSTLAQVFAASGMAIPAGSLPIGATTLDVEVGRTMRSVEDLAALQLQGTDGPVSLSQVADVALSPVDTTTISRANGRPSLTLAVTKQTSGNTVTVSQGVRTTLPEVEGKLGEGVEFTTVFDQAPFIEDSIHDLSVEGMLGLLFAVLVIMVFLMSIRPTIITAISIPLSLVMALIGLRLFGYSLNILTLGALTVAIGRVVDDAIVVIENIKRHQSMGEFGSSSIIRAVREVAGAVTSSTLTTVAVFLPIGLVSGQTGQLFRPFAMTVTIALLASLLVALTVVPVLAYWFMRGRPGEPAAEGMPDAPSPAAGLSPERSLAQGHHSPVTGLQRAYLPALRWALGHRVATLLVAVFVFAGTIALAPRLKTDFLGESGATTVRVTVEMPPGTALAQTDAVATRLEQVVGDDPATESFQTTVGGDAARAFLGSVTGPNDASISVTLRAGSSGTVVADRWRAEIADLSDVGTVSVTSTGSGPGNSNVAVVVESGSIESLRAASDQVVAMLDDVPSLQDVRTDLSETKAMLKVDVDPVAAARIGMVQAQVGSAVAQAVKGTPLGSMWIADEALDVVLRSRAPVTGVEDLSNLLLPVTPKQTAEARKAAAEAVSDRQQALTASSQADQDAAVQEQIAALRTASTKATEQVDALVVQLAALREQEAALAAAAELGPLPAAPSDALTAVRAQIASLERSLAASQAQVTSTQESLSKALANQAKTQSLRAESELLQQAAKDAQSATATAVTLGTIATVREVSSPASVGRVDGVRAATVSATPTGSDLGSTTSAVREGLAKLTLPEGVTVRLAGVSLQQQESFAQLGLAMLAAIAIVYLVMVATFRSLLQPLLLLVSIPFAATGALILLLATDTALGVPAMIGMLMLIGIVVTNAIVLIDLINQYRQSGQGVRDAVVDGARLRLRPILMTALATIFALLPMGLGVTGGGIFISKPLAIVVIGGLVSSTALTLLLVPVLYDLVESWRDRRMAKHAAGRRPPVATPEPEPAGVS